MGESSLVSALCVCARMHTLRRGQPPMETPMSYTSPCLGLPHIPQEVYTAQSWVKNRDLSLLGSHCGDHVWSEWGVHQSNGDSGERVRMVGGRQTSAGRCPSVLSCARVGGAKYDGSFPELVGWPHGSSLAGIPTGSVVSYALATALTVPLSLMEHVYKH